MTELPASTIKEMEDGFADALQKTGSDKPLARVPRTEPSLPDQIAQLERINRSIAEKIRREQVSLKALYESGWVEINNTYTTRISETVSKLEAERDAELLALTESTSRKLHDLEQLARRSG